MKRGRGRPRVDPQQRLVPVTVGLTPKQFDAVCHQALQRGVSVAEVVRGRLRLKQAAPRDPRLSGRDPSSP